MQNFFTVTRSQKEGVSYIRFFHKGKWQKVQDVLHLFQNNAEVNPLKRVEYAWSQNGCPSIWIDKMFITKKQFPQQMY